MRITQILFTKLLLFILLFSIRSNVVYSQNTLYSLSFKANQGRYNDSYAAYYYHIKEEKNKYKLTNKKGENIFKETFDTIIKNTFFIKTLKGNSISIYRIHNLKKIEIPNLKQVYFKRNGLEVLTNKGAQYFDNNITKIDSFPKLNIFMCGTVYSENYTLKYNEKLKKHNIELSNGNFGGIRDETVLEFSNLPENIESLSFLNSKKYTSKSVNNRYHTYPNLIKIVKEGKSGIYSYDLDDSKFPTEKKITKKEKVKKDYAIDEATGDTIFVEPPVVLTPIEPISFTKKGSVTLKQILPIKYNHILQNEDNGLIYLYSNNQIGIYPYHITTSFDFFNKRTTSFYKISKNGKQGWIDIKTFKEYYF